MEFKTWSSDTTPGSLVSHWTVDNPWSINTYFLSGGSLKADLIFFRICMAEPFWWDSLVAAMPKASPKVHVLLCLWNDLCLMSARMDCRDCICTWTLPADLKTGPCSHPLPWQLHPAPHGQQPEKRIHLHKEHEDAERYRKTCAHPSHTFPSCESALGIPQPWHITCKEALSVSIYADKLALSVTLLLIH